MLENIKNNIDRLIAAYESVKYENGTLKDELEQSRTQIEDCRKQIIELERQIDNLKLTSAFLGDSGSNTEAKSKVEKMIKEIDKCISLMEG